MPNSEVSYAAPVVQLKLDNKSTDAGARLV